MQSDSQGKLVAVHKDQEVMVGHMVVMAVGREVTSVEKGTLEWLVVFLVAVACSPEVTIVEENMAALFVVEGFVVGVVVVAAGSSENPGGNDLEQS